MVKLRVFLILSVLLITILSDLNAKPYECGDVNEDGNINILDIITIINFLYNNGPELPVPEQGDIDGCAPITNNDISFLIDYKFCGGPQPYDCPGATGCNLPVSDDILNISNNVILPFNDRGRVDFDLVLTENMNGLSLPFAFACSTSAIFCDSISFVGSDFSATFLLESTDNYLKKGLIGIEGITHPIVGPGNRHIASAWFTIQELSDEIQYILVDTCVYEPSNIPIFSRGYNQPFLPSFTNLSNFNNAPLLAYINEQQVNENQLLEISVSASDYEGDPITLTADPLPGGASFTDFGDGSGLFSWIPEQGQFGTYEIEFVADDGQYSDGQVVLISVFPGATGVNLLINGDFEQAGVNPGSGSSQLNQGSGSITDWIVTRGQIDYIGTYWEYPFGGSRSVDLDGSPGIGGVMTSLGTIPGERYVVLFDLSGNPLGAPAIKHLRVEAAGEYKDYEFDITGHNQSNMGWVHRVWSFTAVASETDLEFYSLDSPGAYGPVIDNVVVFPYSGEYQADLTISAGSINLLPENPIDGQNVTISLDITNIGNGNSGATDLLVASDRLLSMSIGLPIAIDPIMPGGDTSITLNWTADIGVDSLFFMIDPDNNVEEESETNNLAAISVDVINPAQLDMAVIPGYLSSGPSEEAAYNILLINGSTEKHTLEMDVSGLGSLTWVFSDNTVKLLPGQTKRVVMSIEIPSGCAVSQGLYDFIVSATEIDEPATSVSIPATLEIIDQPQITDIVPGDNQTLASNSVVVQWHTSVPSTSEVYYQKNGESGYIPATGQSGINHKVIITDLDFESAYNWYIQSTGACGTYQSDAFQFRTGHGVVFGSREYFHSIKRSYNQEATISIINYDTVPLDVLVEADNPYDDLIVGFTDEGSVDEILTLDPGQTGFLDLRMHAQDATDTNYTFPIKLTSKDNDGNEYSDYASLNISIDWPDTNFVIEDLGFDPNTLVRDMQIINYGDSITDMDVMVAEATGIDYLITPQIQHAIIGPGEHIAFQLIPTFEDTVSSRAFCQAIVKASGAGKEESVELNECCNDEIFQVSMQNVYICSDHSPQSWYCTNRPSISVNLMTPKILSGAVTSATLGITFSPWTNARPHDVDIYINGNHVALLTQTIPSGYMEFPVDPSNLVFSNSGPAINTLQINTSNFNGGHYAVTTNFSLCLCVNNYSEFICASNEAEAEDILNNRPYLFEGLPQEITITEPSTGTINKWSWNNLYIQVNPPHRKYNVTAELTYASGAQQIDLIYDANESLYKASFIPNFCEPASIIATASLCGLIHSDPVNVTVENCDQEYVDVGIEQIYCTSISAEWDPEDPLHYPQTDIQYIGAVITNLGTTPANNFEVELFQSDISLGSVNIPSLAPGEKRFVDRPWAMDSNVNEFITLKAVVNPMESFSDVNPLNNVMTQSVSIYFAKNSAGEAFDLRAHAYSFPNWKLGAEDIKNWFLSIIEDPCYGIDEKLVIRLLRNALTGMFEIGGHCFGMSNTSSLYHEDLSLSPSPAQETYELDKAEALPNIQKYQQHTLLNALSSGQVVFVLSDLLFEADPFYEYNKLVEIIKDYNEAPVFMLYDESSKRFPHAVTPYKAVEFHDDPRQRKIVSVYENQEIFKDGEGSDLPIISRLAVYYKEGNENKFVYGRNEAESFINESFSDNGNYFLGFPYNNSGQYNYRNALVQRNIEDDCNVLTTLLDGLFDYLLLNIRINGKTLLSFSGDIKGYLRDETGNISGFNNPGPVKGGEKYNIINNIPGCEIDTMGGGITFKLPNGTETELYLFGEAVDSITINYIRPGLNQGQSCRLIQFEGVEINENACAYLNLFDSVTTPELLVDDDCDFLNAKTHSPITDINYIYGDVNNDGIINILDIIYMIDYKFKGGAAIYPEIRGDVNCDSQINILDILYLINYKFKGGPAPNCP